MIVDKNNKRQKSVENLQGILEQERSKCDPVPIKCLTVKRFGFGEFERESHRKVTYWKSMRKFLYTFVGE